jgi:branched-chain amino acid aminotransferase
MLVPKRRPREARGKGYDSAVMLDGNSDVAELATANLFMVKDGVVATPICNGTFLNGITRQRTIQLLRDTGGLVVEERRITYDELIGADELFATGNYTKINPVIHIDDRALERGPVAAQAHDLYFDYAERKGGKRS